VANTFNMHPQIVNMGEVLGEWTLPFKLYKKTSWLNISLNSYLNTIYSSFIFFYVAQLFSMISHIKRKESIRFKFKSNIKTIGIKDFSFLIKEKGLDQWLVQAEDLKVIYLYRENILKRYLSLAMMNKTGVVKKEDKGKKSSLHVNISDMLRELDVYSQQRTYEESLISRISANRVIKLRYEDYFCDAETMKKETRRMFDFLDVDPIELKSKQLKISSDNLSELIENYSEVKGALKGTPYSIYLGVDDEKI